MIVTPIAFLPVNPSDTMKDSSKNLLKKIIVAAFPFLLTTSSFAQVNKAPLMQDIQVQAERSRVETYKPLPSSTPVQPASPSPSLVTKTGSSMPANPIPKAVLWLALMRWARRRG